MGKQKIMHKLEQNRGHFVSGEELAALLGQSRAAVWKAVEALRAEGYPITSKPGGGYCLEEKTDMLLGEKIRAALRADVLGRELLLFPTLDSTSTQLRRLAYEGAAEGTVLLADEQTAGRGRFGRSFHSPQRGGIYMSLLLRPRLPFQKIHFLTMLAAVCAAQAIEAVAGVHPQIKWVNDLLLDGKKLCGILSEAAVEGESGALSFVVVGIGINVESVRGFPSLEGNTPASLREAASTEFSRCTLIAEILNTFERLYFPYIETQDATPFLQEYRDRLCLTGRRVLVVQGAQEYEAQVLGLAESGGLLVRRADGTEAELTSGEVSIRGNFSEC